MSAGYLERPAPSGLADVIDTILDKGLVVDAYARVSLLGIELVTLDARVVVASVDTYLRFAEATNRLDLYEKGGKGLTDLVEDLGGPVVEKVASKVAERKVEDLKQKPVGKAVGKAVKAARKVTDLVTPDD
ncbi:MAG: gas vesicle protein [Marmoricola sp.]|nr:gas vesicle protein [Marmoricola sp.]